MWLDFLARNAWCGVHRHGSKKGVKVEGATLHSCSAHLPSCALRFALIFYVYNFFPPNHFVAIFTQKKAQRKLLWFIIEKLLKIFPFCFFVSSYFLSPNIKRCFLYVSIFWLLKRRKITAEGHCCLMFVFSCLHKKGCNLGLFPLSFSKPVLSPFCKALPLARRSCFKKSSVVKIYLLGDEPETGRNKFELKFLQRWWDTIISGMISGKRLSILMDFDLPRKHVGPHTNDVHETKEH